MDNNYKNDYLARADIKRKCYNQAEAVKVALELCASTAEMYAVFADLGLKKRTYTLEGEGVTAEMSEWRDDTATPYEVRVLPLYGVVMVVNYNMPWTQAAVLVSDMTRRRLLDL